MSKVNINIANILLPYYPVIVTCLLVFTCYIPWHIILDNTKHVYLKMSRQLRHVVRHFPLAIVQYFITINFSSQARFQLSLFSSIHSL